MSPSRKNNSSRKKRVVVRSKNRQIIVRSVQRPEPNYKKLARAVVLLAKDMQEAKALGITVDELRHH
jgi:hypothetical protein